MYLYSAFEWCTVKYSTTDSNFIVHTLGLKYAPANAKSPVKIGYWPDISLDCRTRCRVIYAFKENLILSYLIITRNIIYVPNEYHHSSKCVNIARV